MASILKSIATSIWPSPPSLTFGKELLTDILGFTLNRLPLNEVVKLRVICKKWDRIIRSTQVYGGFIGRQVTLYNAPCKVRFIETVYIIDQVPPASENTLMASSENPQLHFYYRQGWIEACLHLNGEAKWRYLVPSEMVPLQVLVNPSIAIIFSAKIFPYKELTEDLFRSHYRLDGLDPSTGNVLWRKFIKSNTVVDWDKATEEKREELGRPLLIKRLSWGNISLPDNTKIVYHLHNAILSLYDPHGGSPLNRVHFFDALTGFKLKLPDLSKFATFLKNLRIFHTESLPNTLVIKGGEWTAPGKVYIENGVEQLICSHKHLAFEIDLSPHNKSE